MPNIEFVDIATGVGQALVNTGSGVVTGVNVATQTELTTAVAVVQADADANTAAIAALTAADVDALGVNNVLSYNSAANDGVTNARPAIVSAQAAGSNTFFAQGTFLVNTSITLTGSLWFAQGAKLRPASGVTITINGTLNAPVAQIFDLSAGGTVVFGTGAIVLEVYPQWWGVDATGATSAVPAFEAVINFVNASPSYPAVKVTIPPGVYDLSTGITTPITRGGVYFHGGGPAVVRLKVRDGVLFHWLGTAPNSKELGGASGFYAYTTTTPAANQQLFKIEDFSRIQLDNIRFTAIRQFIQLGNAASGLSANTTWISRLHGDFVNSAGVIAFDCQKGAGLYARDSFMFVDIPFPADATTLSTAADTTGIRFGKGTWDTVNAYAFNFNRFNRGLDIVPESSATTTNMWWTSCHWDYMKTNGIRLAPVSGSVRSVYFNGCWAVATDGHSIETSGLGSLFNIHFTDTVGRQGGKNNWKLAHPSMNDVRLTACHGLGANRLAATNTGSDQDDLVISASGVSVNGGRFGEDGSTYVGFTNRGRYGVNLAADLEVSMIGVQSEGATDAYLLAANTVSNARRIVTNNTKSGAERPNYAVTVAPAIPTSAVAQEHMAYYSIELYIYGGTVTRIDKSGQQVSNTTPCTLTLRPGDSYAITYSVAPTIREYRLP